MPDRVDMHGDHPETDAEKRRKKNDLTDKIMIISLAIVFASTSIVLITWGKFFSPWNIYFALMCVYVVFILAVRSYRSLFRSKR